MSVKKKFFLAITLLISVVVIAGAIFTIVSRDHELTNTAESQASDARQRVVRLLSVTDSIMMDRVKSSMQVLIKRGEAIGSPGLGKDTRVGDRTVPQLLLGNQGMANHFELVDDLTQDMKGTATLFVYDGQNYVRVSTNVKKDGGQRATGTILNPDGGAFRAIESGQAFYGQVDILGNPYLTGYAPMRSSAGQVVGIWYVGYSADMSILADAIAGSRVLEKGFVALVDDKGRVRMHSDNQTDETVQAALASNNGDWVKVETPFTPWGYTVVSAYSAEELTDTITADSISIALVIAGVGALLILAIHLLITAVITRPLNQMIGAVNDIADGEGDLTIRFNATSRDEFGQMANGFDKLLARVQDTIRDVGHSSREVLEASQGLVQVAEDSSQSIARQTSDTQHVASSMHEMSLTAQNVAESASVAEEAAKGAEDDARSGHTLVQETIRTIEQQTQTIAECAEAVAELDEHSEAISSVLDVIHSIAEQTNLLALNAAIEAARAGEHGRGFAVVSDEVRMLATRTQNSIDDIRGQIERLQSGAKGASQKMDATRELAGTLSSKAQESGDAITQMREAVARISERNTDIASAAEEQSQVADEINNTLERIHNHAQETSSQADRTRAASQELIALAERLQKELSSYKV
ncbi:methyl-accepting chemotaxis protein [Marinobacter bohaiensis]|uniref:methyl-accepting chemotaxis protein n=1 Tax=Marinobacter bohaiensis TaxID=2201898 RepID=UPI000DAD424D|nr:methyl-accepting chemotaxis protein [Marinobacter bohaiensis]